MKNVRKYAVIGTGAIGGFYGAKLQRSGIEVHFLLHRDYEYVKQHGLVIESADGNFTLPQVNAYNDVNKIPACDVVLVTLKTTDNFLLPKLLPNLVKDDGVVLVLQNGLNLEPYVADIVGDHRVMGGLCFICSNKIDNGHIHHLDYGQITLGDYAKNYRACGITERMKAIAEDLEKAEISIQLSSDLLLSRWKKLVWNIPFNGLSVVLRTTTDEIMSNFYTRNLAENLMREVVSIASVNQRYISSEFVEKMLIDTEKMKPYSPSMKLDYEAKRPLEIEAIFGNPLKVAQQGSIKAPRIEMIYQQLQFLDHFSH
ncbi:putative 2-dehydropantoate 2-reductase [Gloeothece verrucosa]|uniref:2-dehydropantoate 2-reductase n=1 Tax=Gloeothece verrucosa (strain PCC 7822) TaxID=497965 RepID=E0U6I7_GLOV7|nr:putative 2-dehydropantoate 2-reductase [Gloeothece verrucosa]ADN13630.1 2-dehydropantoate 2-reductase [Gloeothece verrucosa PCC 7822]